MNTNAATPTEAATPPSEVDKGRTVGIHVRIPMYEHPKLTIPQSVTL